MDLTALYYYFTPVKETNNQWHLERSGFGGRDKTAFVHQPERLRAGWNCYLLVNLQSVRHNHVQWLWSSRVHLGQGSYSDYFQWLEMPEEQVPPVLRAMMLLEGR